MEIGYWLSSEEHAPRELVENAKLAELAGFEFALISDHIHPWVDAQGHSPFVWGVIGAIGQATDTNPDRDCCHVPADPHPPCDRRSRRRDGPGAAGRTFLPRRRDRGKSQRARLGCPLAAGRRAARDARGSDRDHPQAVRGRLRDVPRQALHRRTAQTLRRPGQGPADHHGGEGGGLGAAGRGSRGRHDEHDARRRDRDRRSRKRAATGRSTARSPARSQRTSAPRGRSRRTGSRTSRSGAMSLRSWSSRATSKLSRSWSAKTISSRSWCSAMTRPSGRSDSTNTSGPASRTSHCTTSASTNGSSSSSRSSSCLFSARNATGTSVLLLRRRPRARHRRASRSSRPQADRARSGPDRSGSVSHSQGRR